MAEGAYWSGNISFAGLGSGTDFNKLIDGLMKTESYHKRRLENWKKGWEDKSKELQNLNKKVLGLQTLLEKMDTSGELLGKKISSSNQTVVAATPSGDADFGSHQVEVKQLATSDNWANTTFGYTSQDAVITTSNTTFTFSYAGKITTINVPQNTTLKQFVNIVNNHGDLKGKVAGSMLFDGTDYHFQLQGLELGEANSIALSNTGIPGMAPGNFDHIRTAQDALFKVDGFPPGSNAWLHRESNTVGDAIKGLSLNLKSAAPGTVVEVTVSQDDSKTVETIQKFVDGVNEIRTQIQKLTKVEANKDPQTDKDDKSKSTIQVGRMKGSILTGNYGVEMVSQELKHLVASAGLGFANVSGGAGEDAFTSLAGLGISTDASKGSATYGLLKLDKEELKKALKEDPKAVTRLFTADHELESSSPDFTAVNSVKGTTHPGTHKVAYTVSGGVITSATINGEPASVSGWSITGKSGGPAAGLRLDVTNQADGTYDGDVRIKQGKIHEMLNKVNELTSPSTGTLKIIEDNYASIIRNIEKKIDWEDQRLRAKERRYKLKFSRLDALLGEYQKKQQALTSQVAKLNK